MIKETARNFGPRKKDTSMGDSKEDQERPKTNKRAGAEVLMIHAEHL